MEEGQAGLGGAWFRTARTADQGRLPVKLLMAVSTVATELAEGRADNQVAESVLHGGQVGCLAWSDPETVGREVGGGHRATWSMVPREEGCQIGHRCASVLGVGIRERWCCRSLTKKTCPHSRNVNCSRGLVEINQ